MTPRIAHSPSGRRSEVLRALKLASRPLSIAEIAERLDVHPNTVRFHLGTLVETGQVDQVASERSGPGRPPLMFRAAPGMDPTGPRNYRLLAEVLTGILAALPRRTDRALEAGRSWGRSEADSVESRTDVGTDSVTRLVDLMDDLGFAPERGDGLAEARIGLRQCPFLEIAEHEPGVVCPIHLGLMQGAMEVWDAPLAVESLEPFAEPDLCVAHLASRGG